MGHERVDCPDCGKDWGPSYCGTCRGRGFLIRPIEEPELNESSPVLTLECQEGWSYIGWQRVYVSTHDGISAAKEVADELNKTNGGDGEMFIYVSKDPNNRSCLFILSGESYTFEDFAESVEAILGLKTIIIDGID